MIATRYAPFAVLSGAMLMLVIVAPSKATPTASAFPYMGPSGPAAPGATSTLQPGQTPGATAGAAPSTGAQSSTGAAATGPGVAAGAVSGRLAAGDTTHCVNGHQFGELATAPPCTPHFVGNNGGATWTGVTGDTIKVVYYREKDNPAVAAILQGAGLYSNPTDQQAFIAAANKFITSHYELYGRKLAIEFYQGNCSPAPPDPACYRQDVNRLVSSKHPFAVIYDNNTNSPDFFDELSKLQTINWGGWHFTDSFSAQHRPWHWDVYTSGDYQAVETGEYWCNRLANKPARFAGDVALQTMTRKVAIVVPAYPTTVEAAHHLQAIINGCAPNSAEVIAYSSDTSTATAQATNDVAKERQDGITSILWFSDPIAPVYGTNAESSQGYHPEEVLVGSGLLDYDVLAQLYNPDEWKHAFGPSDIQDALPFSKTDAAIVWRTAGQSGDPYSSANLPWSYFASLSYILNQTGPTLNPGTFERAAFGGPWPNYWMLNHDASHPWLKWGPNPSAVGAYAGISDAREVYWDPSATSPVNGKKGSYATLNNHARFRIGQWPRGEPALPPGV
jgi:hypothetical protein